MSEKKYQLKNLLFRLLPKNMWQDCGNYWLHTAPQGTPEWLEVRKGRPSGSIIGTLLGHSKFNTPEKEIQYLAMREEKIFTPETLAIMSHGNQFEDTARKYYEKFYNKQVDELGFVVPKSELRIGVSVDGIVGEDGVIEIKCPRRMYAPLLNEGKIWPTHYDQMQMGMYILGRKWCDYVVLDTESGLLAVQHVPYNPQYWAEAMKKINNILDTQLTPLLANTQYPIMPI